MIHNCCQMRGKAPNLRSDKASQWFPMTQDRRTSQPIGCESSSVGLSMAVNIVLSQCRITSRERFLGICQRSRDSTGSWVLCRGGTFFYCTITVNGMLTGALSIKYDMSMHSARSPWVIDNDIHNATGNTQRCTAGPRSRANLKANSLSTDPFLRRPDKWASSSCRTFRLRARSWHQTIIVIMIIAFQLHWRIATHCMYAYTVADNELTILCRSANCLRPEYRAEEVGNWKRQNQFFFFFQIIMNGCWA
jgi:hypothetical protein